jgi:hypothetical protein
MNEPSAASSYSPRYFSTPEDFGDALYRVILRRIAPGRVGSFERARPRYAIIRPDGVRGRGATLMSLPGLRRFGVG